jgi:hypothetical protein
MKQDSFFHSLKLIFGFLAIVLLAWLLGGCGSLVRLEYQNPQYGGGAVVFTLPTKGGYAK